MRRAGAREPGFNVKPRSFFIAVEFSRVLRPFWMRSFVIYTPASRNCRRTLKSRFLVVVLRFFDEFYELLLISVLHILHS